MGNKSKKINSKKIKKWAISLVLICFAINILGNCYVMAAGATSVNGMWSSASSWFGKIRTNANSEQAVDIINEFIDMINVIGTTVIVLATIVLGVKYIIGSVETKADVKESLITLLVACVFFFGWTGISSILIPNGRLIFSSTSDTTYTSMVGRIFSTGTFIANVAAIAGVIYVGVRYIFAGADGKADLKSRSPYLIIGIILAFASVSFLTFLSNVINDIV